MPSSTKPTRRRFMQIGSRLAAAGFAIPTIIPSHVLAAPGRTGANDRTGIGSIGVGRRGRQLFGLPEGAETVAVSDVNQARMAEVTQDKNWQTFQDYRDLLECKDVDAVVIATPDHWHAANAIHACEAGKDVYCEKPMTLTVREGRAMVEAARKHGRVVQTGSQQRSMQECRIGCELVRNGRIGKVHTVHGANYPSPWECDLTGQPIPEGLDWDMWLGQAPYRPYHIDLYLPRANPGWISFRPYSGGEMTGWGSHGLDLIQWALGKDDTGPVEVWPEGEGLKCEVGFRYADGTVVRLDGKGPSGGGLFVGEEGEILVDRGKFETRPEEIAQEPLGDSDIRLPVSMEHRGNWIDCIRSREKPIADVEIGHSSATMCHLGNIARWLGRKLQWDPEKELFVEDEEANRFLERPRREPWVL